MLFRRSSLCILCLTVSYFKCCIAIPADRVRSPEALPPSNNHLPPPETSVATVTPGISIEGYTARDSAQSSRRSRLLPRQEPGAHPWNSSTSQATSDGIAHTLRSVPTGSSWGTATASRSRVRPVLTDRVSGDAASITVPPGWFSETKTYASDLPNGHPANSSTLICTYSDKWCELMWSSSWAPCSNSWSSWSVHDVVYTSTPIPVPFDYHITSTSYSQYLTSVYDGTTFEYALGSGVSVDEPTRTLTMYSTEITLVLTTLKPPPSCTWKAWLEAAQTGAVTCSSCQVQGGTVELLYWADMATSSLTANRTHVGTLPVTALYKNTTLTSPTVYIEFQTAYATNECGQTVGEAYPGAIIGMDAHSLYSIQGLTDYNAVTYSDGQVTTFYPSAPFDFHNLDGLVPVSVYRQQPSCVAYGCYTIYDNYAPVLVLPSQIRNMDPAWKSCGLDYRGSWDPPIALHPAEHINPVTTSIVPQHTVSASPHSTVSGPASQTSATNGALGTSDLPSSSDSALSSASNADLPFSSAGQPDAASTATASQNQPQSNSVAAIDGPVDEPPSSPAGELPSVTSVIQVTTTFQVAAQPSTSTENGNLPESIASGASEGTIGVSSAVIPEQATATVAYLNPSNPGWSSSEQPIATESVGQGASMASSGATQDAVPSTLLVAGQQVSSVAGGIVVGSSTLVAGGEPLTVSSVAYSAAINGGLVVVSDSYVPSADVSPTNAYQVLTEAQQTAATQAVAADPEVVTDDQGSPHTIIAASDGGYVADQSVTLPSGGMASVTGLGILSAVSDGVVVSDGAAAPSTVRIAPLNTAAPSRTMMSSAIFSLSGVAYTAVQAPSGTLLIEGGAMTAAVTQGQLVTMPAGQTLSLDSNGNAVVAGETMYLSDPGGGTDLEGDGVSAAQQSATQGIQAAVTLGSEVLTAAPVSLDPSVVHMGSMTLSVGGPAGFNNGHTVSAASDGVVEDGTLVTYSTPTSTAAPSLAIVTLSGTTITAVHQTGGAVRVGSRLLVPGGDPTVIEGHTLSAAMNGMVEDGTTISFSDPPTLSTQTEALLTLGTSVLTAYQASETSLWALNGKTLSVGGSAFVSDGHTISAGTACLLDNGHAVGFSTVVSTPSGSGADEGSRPGSVSLPAVMTPPATAHVGGQDATEPSSTPSSLGTASTAASARKSTCVSFVFVLASLVCLAWL